MSEKLATHTTDYQLAMLDESREKRSSKNALKNNSMRSLDENKKSFHETYWEVFSSITDALGVDPGKSEMLMALESRVTPVARSSGWSEWLMQLNTHPVRDLGKRFKLYAPILEKLELKEFPKNTPKPLIDLIEITQNPDSHNLKQVKSLISELIKLRGHPIVNLVIGNVFLKFHEARAQRVVDSNKTSSSSNALHKISQSPELLQSVYKKVREIYPSASPEKIVTSLSQIQGSKDLLKEYISLRNYNGNVAAKHGLEYRDIYASTVLIADMLQKQAARSATKLPIEENIDPIDYSLVA